MAIQFVNTGSSSNKGDGDSIRLAFTKVNNNFSQLGNFFINTGSANFLNLEVDNQADIGTLIVSTGTFDNLFVNDIFSVGTYLGFDDSQLVKNNASGLSYRMLNLYPLSKSEILFSDSDNGNFVIGHQNSGSSSFFHPAGGNYIFSDLPTQSINIGLYSDINFYASEQKWLNPLLSIQPSITIKKADGSITINNTVESVDLIPKTNLAYDLGSLSKQWRSLYVGTSTIYLGGTALSVADGQLTVGGTPVQGGGGIALGDRLTSSTYEVILEGTTGTVSVPNTIISQGYELGLAGSQGSYEVGRYLRVRDGDVFSHLHLDTPDNSSYDIILGDDSKFLKVDHTGTVVIGTNNGTQNVWTFGIDGSLTFPDNTVQTSAYQIVSAPVTSTSTGATGTISYDSSYFYVCTATNSWQRIAWDNTPW